MIYCTFLCGDGGIAQSPVVFGADTAPLLQPLCSSSPREELNSLMAERSSQSAGAAPGEEQLWLIRLLFSLAVGDGVQRVADSVQNVQWFVQNTVKVFVSFYLLKC